MANPVFDISTQSIVGIPAIVHYDSQFENEPLYLMWGIMFQTRDGKENPPRMATYYVFDGSKCPLCYGFCAVLFNWALQEAYNRFAIAHPEEKVIIRTSDLCFDFEAFVPVDELCATYLNIISVSYKGWLRCSPAQRHFTDTSDALASRILIDEYDNYIDFTNRGIYGDLTEKQQEDFHTWWLSIEDYITRQYKLEIPLHLIPERVTDFLLDSNRIHLPAGRTLSSFSQQATLNLDRANNAKSTKNISNIINVMPTYNFYDNSQCNNNCRNINIVGNNVDAKKFIADIMRDDKDQSVNLPPFDWSLLPFIHPQWMSDSAKCWDIYNHVKSILTLEPAIVCSQLNAMHESKLLMLSGVPTKTVYLHLKNMGFSCPESTFYDKYKAPK